MKVVNGSERVGLGRGLNYFSHDYPPGWRAESPVDLCDTHFSFRTSRERDRKGRIADMLARMH